MKKYYIASFSWRFDFSLDRENLVIGNNKKKVKKEAMRIFKEKHSCFLKMNPFFSLRNRIIVKEISFV
jgi:hypothetical protein